MILNRFFVCICYSFHHIFFQMIASEIDDEIDPTDHMVICNRFCLLLLISFLNESVLYKRTVTVIQGSDSEKTRQSAQTSRWVASALQTLSPVPHEIDQYNHNKHILISIVSKFETSKHNIHWDDLSSYQCRNNHHCQWNFIIKTIIQATK